MWCRQLVSPIAASALRAWRVNGISIVFFIYYHAILKTAAANAIDATTMGTGGDGLFFTCVKPMVLQFLALTVPVTIVGIAPFQ